MARVRNASSRFCGAGCGPPEAVRSMDHVAALVHKSVFGCLLGQVWRQPRCRDPACRTSTMNRAVTKIRRPGTEFSNWREYGQALQQRGSVIVRVTPEVLEAWAPARAGHHGRASAYSDIATKTAVMLRPFSRCSVWICRFQTKQPRPGPGLGCRWQQH